LALETETDDPQRIAVSQHDWAGVTVLGPDRDAASAGDQDCAI
jgi:hypothetical protein